MRPDKDTIAAPDLPTDIEWIGEAPESMPILTAAGPALVHFVDLTQLNSVRTLPYLIEWNRRYKEHGLDTIAVQSSRFPFGDDRDNVAAAVERLGIDFPVAIDSKRELWLDYGCEGWPSLFLWAQGGALTWFHFGEGEYLGSEEAIQGELREMDALRELPRPLAPLRNTDGPGARVMPPSPEQFPSGSWERAWTAGEDGDRLDLPYEGGGAYATVEGVGELAVELDGAPVGTVAVDGPALYALAEHERHESHRLTVVPSPGLRVWSLSFAAGVP